MAALTYEMVTGKLPYGRGFANARDVQWLKYIPATAARDGIPQWFDAALAKALAKKPSERTEALSAFFEDISRPNRSLGYERSKPLIARNPLIFWQSLCAALTLFVAILLYLIARH